MSTSPDLPLCEASRPPLTLVIGADGFIGRHLAAAYRRWYPEAKVTTKSGGGPGRLALDLGTPDIDAARLAGEGYRYAVIAAGVTGLAACETAPEETRRVNVDGTLKLAGCLSRAGIIPIWFSTDYVFDGINGNYDETCKPDPLNEYGRQKCEVEKALYHACNGRYLIIRLSKIFDLDARSNTLLNEMVDRLQSEGDIYAAVDQVFSPTLIDDVVQLLFQLQLLGCNGLFHISSPEVWTRFELARLIARTIQADPCLIHPISLDDLSESFVRPKKTNLISRYHHLKQSQDFTPMRSCLVHYRP